MSNFLTFSTIAPRSPVSQAFIWMAEYADGALTEFDDGGEHEFTEIDADRVVRFGLVGQGVKVWFERTTGAFNFAGQHLAFVLEHDDRREALPGVVDVDLITYKRCELNVAAQKPEITGFYVGYKGYTLAGGGCWFKAIVNLNAGETPCIDTSLTFVNDFVGELSLYVNFRKFTTAKLNVRRGESTAVKFTLGGE